MDAAYPDDVFVDDRTVDSHIKRMRRKFRKHRWRILGDRDALWRRATASAMAEKGSVLQGRSASLDKLRWSRRLSLTSRILFVNVLPLVLLGGGVLYLDSYRKQLLDERFKLALVEAQITAEALAGATPQRQEALLIQIGKEQRLRIRVYGPDGKLESDSFASSQHPVLTLPEASRSRPERFRITDGSLV